MLKTSLIILVISFTLYNCKSAEEEKLNRNNRIITNCILAFKEMNQIYIDSTYIINPKCGEFEFNSYTNKFYPQFRGQKSGSLDEVYELLNWNDSIFNTRKKEIDLKNSNQICYREISQKLSNDKSTWLITFSAIDNNIVFAELIKFCQPITLEDINENNDYLKKPKFAVASWVVILKDENIIDILNDNLIASEGQCN
jgi:hypothetical protein